MHGVTLEQIEAREFSYVSINYILAVPIDEHHPFGRSHAHYKIIIGSPSVPRCRRLGQIYGRLRWGGWPNEVNVYPRNYIRDARAMVRQGECLQG